jgi:hypothetical protein
MSSLPPRNGDDTWLVRVVLRGLQTLGDLPVWLRPPILGAGLMLVIAALRGFVILLAMPASVRNVVHLALAIIVSTGGGALAGVAYVLVRPLLKHLGPLGDLFTGVVVGCAYVFAILLPAKHLLGDDTLVTGRDWGAAWMFGTVFGLAVAVLYLFYRRRYR